MIWQQYKNNDTNTSTIDTTTMTQINRYLYDIQQRQQRSKGASDEFERFITAPAITIDSPAIDWWLQQQQRTSSDNYVMASASDDNSEMHALERQEGEQPA